MTPNEDDEYSAPYHPDNIHRVDIETYHRILEIGVVCHRLHLIEGIIECRDTRQPYRYKPSDFDAFVAGGIIDPEQVELVDGFLVDKNAAHNDGT